MRDFDKKPLLFTIVPIMIGIGFVLTFGMIIAQVVFGLWAVQHPSEVGNFAKDLLAPVIQELKK